MREMVKLVLSLGLICLVGAAALAYVHDLTREPIARAEQAALQTNLKLVLPPETADVSEFAEADGVLVFRATDSQGKTVGYAAEAVGTGGFKGDVKVLVGLHPDATIGTVVVTGHNETPGIGSKATDRKARRSLWDVLKGRPAGTTLPPNSFLDAFSGRPVAQGGGTVQAVSGATYSSHAVIMAVDKVCRAAVSLNLGMEEQP